MNNEKIAQELLKVARELVGGDIELDEKQKAIATKAFIREVEGLIRSSGPIRISKGVVPLYDGKTVQEMSLEDLTADFDKNKIQIYPSKYLASQFGPEEKLNIDLPELVKKTIGIDLKNISLRNFEKYVLLPVMNYFKNKTYNKKVRIWNSEYKVYVETTLPAEVDLSGAVYNMRFDLSVDQKDISEAVRNNKIFIPKVMLELKREMDKRLEGLLEHESSGDGILKKMMPKFYQVLRDFGVDGDKVYDLIISGDAVNEQVGSRREIDKEERHWAWVTDYPIYLKTQAAKDKSDIFDENRVKIWQSNRGNSHNFEV